MDQEMVMTFDKADDLETGGIEEIGANAHV